MHGEKENEKMKNMKLTRLSLRLLLVLWGLTLIAGVVSAQLSAEEIAEKDTMAKLGAGIALAGCGIGTGLGQGQIGAAAVGWVAEDGSKLGLAMLFTVLPETILIFGFLAMFLL
jgi:V/A-type H+-transporting ATPase subunit K